MMDDELSLINRTPSGRSSRGKVIYNETKTTTLCEVVEVSRSEFYDSSQAGIKAEYEFVINPAEYNNEIIVEYKGRRYKVYRHYQRSDDELELYCEFLSGLNPAPSDPEPEPEPEPEPDGGDQNDD